MWNIIKKIKAVFRYDLIQFVIVNFFSSSVKRKKGCYLFPYKGTKIQIAHSAQLILNGNLYLNANKYKGSSAESYFSLYEDSILSIEDSTRVNYGSTINLNPGAELKVGSFTTNVGVNFQIRKKATIGKDCMFGRNVFLFDSSFHPTGMSEDSLITNTKEVVIGDHVWIGANSFITAGSNIGNCSIIGSGTYISGMVPEYTTVVRSGDQPKLTGNMWARSEENINQALKFYKQLHINSERSDNTDDSLKNEITNVLKEKFPSVDFSSSNKLITDHIIDSLSVIGIVALLESAFDIKIPYYEIAPANFNSLSAMSAMISRLSKRTIIRNDLDHVQKKLGCDSGDYHQIDPQNTLIEYIKAHAEKNPEKIAVISNNESYTYSDLYELARRYGSYLIQRGVKHGDRIVVKSKQSIDYIITYLGSHYAGAIITTVEKDAKNEKIIEIAKAVNADYIVSDNADNFDTGSYCFIDSKNVMTDCNNSVIKEIPFPDANDSADILFTTGTTGRAKGVELSHTAVLAGAENIAFGCEMKKDTVLVVPNPLSHSNAIKNLAACLITGCTFYVLDGITDLKSFFNALDCNYGKVATVLPPAAIRTIFQLAKDKLAEYTDKLDYLMAATAPLPETDRKTLRRLLPKTRLYNHYGCSESSSICIYDFNKYPDLRNCVGKAMPHSKVFFVDENRKIIKSSSDNIGYLAVSGDATMKGYYGDPKLTSEIKEGNTIYTKDMGYMDQNGFVFVLGRNDDIINVGGLKVSPLDVESAALAYSGVSDCICIGVNDEISGQALKLLIKQGNRFNIDELKEVMSSKLDGYQIPKQIEIVDKIERTYNGKLNRKAYKI